MKIKLYRPNKIVIIIVMVAILTPTVAFSVNEMAFQQPIPSASLDTDNGFTIAADISNLTGAGTEQILQMKASGRSWNDILEELKWNKPVDHESGKTSRSQILVSSSLSEETVTQLIAKGYTENSIMGAKQIAERVAQQVEQLIDNAQPVELAGLPKAGADLEQAGSKEEHSQALEAIGRKFSLEDAVYWMLVLNGDLGGYETVLDEYLLSLQLGLNLNDYLLDKEQYNKMKEQKKLELQIQSIITMSDIERLMLENIQKLNSASRETSLAGTPLTTGSSSNQTSNNPLPDVPTPKVTDGKPVNPAAAVQEELNRLNPNILPSGH